MTADMSNIDAWLQDSRNPGDAGYLPPLYLQPQYGFVPQKFDGGFPEIRSVDDKRPASNGTFDFTEFFGARAVNLQLTLAPEVATEANLTDQKLEDRLKIWMDPSRRTYLYIRTNPLDDYRRILLRSANASGQINLVTKTEFRAVSLAWKGIDGVFESADLQTDVLNPGAATELGRTYDQAYDKAYAASDTIGSKTIYNYGTAPTFPRIRIYGPVTGPRIENATTGDKLEFLAAYALVAGEFLDIDFREGTVYLNGDPTNSRYDKIDFAGGLSDWWTLIPGPNLVRFYPLIQAAPAQAQIDWRSAYL